jgi:threonine synthase
MKKLIGVLLETAHPAKFVEVVEDVLKETMKSRKTCSF